MHNPNSYVAKAKRTQVAQTTFPDVFLPDESTQFIKKITSYKYKCKNIQGVSIFQSRQNTKIIQTTKTYTNIFLSYSTSTKFLQFLPHSKKSASQNFKQHLKTNFNTFKAKLTHKISSRTWQSLQQSDLSPFFDPHH